MGREAEASSQPLSDAELRALRGSKFAPLPAPAPSSRAEPRLAHPGGAMTTNKAAALAKFLERKLQQPGGLDSIDHNLLELAVRNAKETVNASSGGSSNSGRIVRHVASFGDSSEDSGEDQDKTEERKHKKNKKKDSGEDQHKTEERKRKKKKRQKQKKKKRGCA